MFVAIDPWSFCTPLWYKMVTILVSSSWSNRLLETEWFINNRDLFHTVLGARKLRMKMDVWWEPASWSLAFHCPYMADGARPFSRISFFSIVILFMKLQPSYPIHHPKAPLPDTIITLWLDLGVNFGETQTFSLCQGRSNSVISSSIISCNNSISINLYLVPNSCRKDRINAWFFVFIYLFSKWVGSLTHFSSSQVVFLILNSES